jgi:hypothetical protein
MLGLRKTGHVALAAISVVTALLCGAAQADEFDAAYYASPLALQVERATYQFASLAPFAPSAFPSIIAPVEPFGAETSALAEGRVQAKWQSVKNQLALESLILQRCRSDASICPTAARQFLALIDHAQTRDGLARIGDINRAINLDIKPVSDKAQYGVEDLWATPLMTFTSHAGDCEDYAIAKFVALRHDGRWLILDNRTLTMRQDETIAAFDPLFMIDRDGVKQVHAPKPAAPLQAALANGSAS